MTMHETYLLGIDAGGTHTVCLLADGQERILGRGQAGPGNLMATGLEATVAAIHHAVAAAWQAAGLTEQIAHVACLGLAGVERQQEKQALAAALTSLHIARRVLIVIDAHIALAAGSPDGTGVVVIAGTGSIAWGRNRQGKVQRAGGWGYILGDEGSAFDIGLAALRAAVRAHDGRGQPTLLKQMILDHWRLAHLDDLRTVVYRSTYPRPEIAALAPVVEQAARQGDALARQIYTQAAHELALAATTVISSLGMQGEPVNVVLSGGVYQADDLIIEPFTRAVQRVAPQAQIIKLAGEPAQGAVRLAARELAT